jgi:DnaK suppressor protein
MSPKEMTHFQRVLEARRVQLEELLRNREGIVAGSNSDMLDQIQHASECSMAIGNLDRSSSQLCEVRAALGRIQLATFGICLDCDEEISLKRLAAVPWAASCLHCREAADTMTAITAEYDRTTHPQCGLSSGARLGPLTAQGHLTVYRYAADNSPLPKQGPQQTVDRPQARRTANAGQACQVTIMPPFLKRVIAA